MKFSIIFFTVVVSMVAADPGDAHGGHGGYAPGPAKYDFGYGVQDAYSGANFGHSESRSGYKTTGSYYVNLPDGRVQKVSYIADEYGYHPVVTYSGKVHFPSHGAAPYVPSGYH